MLNPMFISLFFFFHCCFAKQCKEYETKASRVQLFQESRMSYSKEISLCILLNTQPFRLELLYEQMNVHSCTLSTLIFYLLKHEAASIQERELLVYLPSKVTYDILPNGAKAALISSVVISGLRSPTKTWKWSFGERGKKKEFKV